MGWRGHWNFRSRPLVLLIFLLAGLLFSSTQQVNRGVELHRFSAQPYWRDLTHAQAAYENGPRTRLQSRNRAFISGLPNNTTDGLGHRFAIINYELLLSTYLKVGYVHRVATYGSLSPPNDPDAVERLFGWDRNLETRDEIFSSSCEVEYKTVGDCIGKFPICKRLKPMASFEHLIHIPTDITDCLRNQSISKADCVKALRSFGEKHNESNTLFQMIPSMCESEYREGGLDVTGVWFREQYWKRHHDVTILSLDKHRRKHRVLPFEKDRLQIAVHVRRGDFIHYPLRKMVPDKVYADVIAAVKIGADEAMQRKVPVSVAIFSEGVPRKGRRLRYNHDVRTMDAIYMTENGEKIRDTARHWRKLVFSRLAAGADVRVRTFIATDTISAIHTMACADVFIGSASGLSMQLVAALSRGLQILPTKPKRPATGKTMSIRYWYDAENKTRIVMPAVQAGIRVVFSRDSHF